MVGVAVLAIVAALAAPSYRQFGRSTRVVTQSSELHHALAFARSESLRRGARVTLCRSADPQAATPSCAGSGDWASGWIVFVDGSTVGLVDGTDTVLRAGDPLQDSTVTVAGNLDAWVAFNPQGLVSTRNGAGSTAASGSWQVCQRPHARRVAITPVGVATSTTETCP
jgi:type IV fimbrial biogenesis protein FimT